MKPLESGTTIQGRYEIKSLIGKGGMGQVYLAVDQRLGHFVALKRTTVGDDPTLAIAFENEARMLAQLRHPYLPKVSDHFVEGDEPFLVMEYIEGDDLSQRLKSLDKPFPLNWVLFWADELLEALTYLHTQEPPIIHRDIKPQNLKLTNDNHIVLLDFGLSKHSTGMTKLTTSGSVVGYTPHYAPMEQIRGTGTSAVSDIYALSATLFHILSNRIPPDALTRADALLSGNPDPLRPLMEFNGEVTERISEAVLKGMELNQANRFQTAREMQKKLRKAYNELQKSMSAETLAFNIEDLEGDGEEAAGEKTEVIPGGMLPEEEPASVPSVAGDKTEVIDSAQMQELAEVHASEAPDAVGAEQAGEKTEVMSGFPSLPVDDGVVGEAPAPEAPDAYETSEDVSFESERDTAGFVTNDEFDAADFEPAGVEDPEEPEATVAGISLDSGFGPESTPTAIPGGSSAEFDEFDEPQESPGFTEVFEEEGIEPEFVEEEDEEPTVAPVAQAAEAKSSTGKYVAILLGLGAILFLIFGSVVAVGWYYVNGGFGFGDPTPEPTQTETPFEQASPEFTPFEGTPEESPLGSPEESPSPEESVTPDTVRTPTPRRTPARTPVRTPTRTPRKTPTPRATPRKTPRTLPTILQ